MSADVFVVRLSAFEMNLVREALTEALARRREEAWHAREGREGAVIRYARTIDLVDRFDVALARARPPEEGGRDA